MTRTNIPAGGPWEAAIGYSRAVRVGSHIWVSGTTAAATAENGVEGPNDCGEQTRSALRRIEKALQEAGAQLDQVVRTRIFTTDISQWEAIGRAHGEFFGSIRPVTTMVQVSALIAPELLVEIEAEAFVE